MDKLEKVINGLEDIRKDYEDMRCKVSMAIIDDAIALLKAQEQEIEDLKQEIEGHKDNLRETLDEMMRYADELKMQEPRVMTLSGVRNLKESTPVWLEDVDKKDVIGALFMRDYSGTKCVDFAIVRDWEFERVVADYMDYGVRWRCWTSRPTDEQREAIPLFICGACGGEIGAGGIAKYCFHCGQEVKWK